MRVFDASSLVEEGNVEDLPCSHCGGDCIQENPDYPLYGDEHENCGACNGTGERKHQTIF